MMPIPTIASRPAPQRSSAEDRTSAAATLCSPVPSTTTIRARSYPMSVPKATATAVSGRV
jgi:hypothetical protein